MGLLQRGLGGGGVSTTDYGPTIPDGISVIGDPTDGNQSGFGEGTSRSGRNAGSGGYSGPGVDEGGASNPSGPTDNTPEGNTIIPDDMGNALPTSLSLGGLLAVIIALLLIVRR